MRIFAAGFYSTRNKGDVALVQAMLAALQRSGSVEVTLTSFTPEIDDGLDGLDGMDGLDGLEVSGMLLRPDSPVVDRARRALSRCGLARLVPWIVVAQVLGFIAWLRLAVAADRLVPGLAGRLLSSRQAHLYQAARSCDVAVAVPGGYLMAPTVRDVTWLYHVAVLALPLLLRRPLVLLPCSLGPFPGVHALVARRLLRACDRVVVREEPSLEIARRLGVPPDRLSLAPDAAFAFAAPAGPPEPRAGTATVAVSVRAHDFPGCPRPAAALQRYLEGVAEGLRRLVADAGVQVVVVAQVVDDEAASARLVELVDRPDAVTLAAHGQTPAALTRLYGLCDLVVGTRMHANILAMTQGTAVAPIAYEHKTPGIMRSAGLPDHWVPITAPPEAIADFICDSWHARRALHDAVAAVAPRLGCEADAAMTAAVTAAVGGAHAPEGAPHPPVEARR